MSCAVLEERGGRESVLEERGESEREGESESERKGPNRVGMECAALR